MMSVLSSWIMVQVRGWLKRAILVVIQFNAISMGDPPEDDSIPLHRREWARLQAGPSVGFVDRHQTADQNLYFCSRAQMARLAESYFSGKHVNHIVIH